MKILINGALGYMGREVTKLCDAGYRGAEAVALVDMAGGEVYSSLSEVDERADCIVDFSHHTAVIALLDYAVSRGIPTVVATTGHTEEELEAIKRASESIPVFHSGNMSLGIALLCETAKTVAAAMPEAEIEIVETHHNRKLDAPSGTALMLAKAVCEARPECYPSTGRSGHGKREKSEIGIHSVRMGNIVGIHEVIIGTQSQTVTLKHEAHDRALFAEGALAAAEFIIGLPAGLYDMNSLVGADSADRVLTAKR